MASSRRLRSRQDESQAAVSNLFIQLALSKQGELEGTYFNAGRDQTLPLEGYVDPQTQEAAWKISDTEGSPVITTGLYNLTQDVALVQVNFGDHETQSWTLIRITQ